MVFGLGLFVLCKLIYGSQFSTDPLQNLFTSVTVMFSLLRIIRDNKAATSCAFANEDFFDVKIVIKDLKSAAAI
jgi:hypothetical protein